MNKNNVVFDLNIKGYMPLSGLVYITTNTDIDFEMNLDLQAITSYELRYIDKLGLLLTLLYKNNVISHQSYKSRMSFICDCVKNDKPIETNSNIIKSVNSSHIKDYLEKAIFTIEQLDLKIGLNIDDVITTFIRVYGSNKPKNYCYNVFLRYFVFYPIYKAHRKGESIEIFNKKFKFKNDIEFIHSMDLIRYQLFSKRVRNNGFLYKDRTPILDILLHR